MEASLHRYWYFDSGPMFLFQPMAIDGAASSTQSPIISVAILHLSQTNIFHIYLIVPHYNGHTEAHVLCDILLHKTDHGSAMVWSPCYTAVSNFAQWRYSNQ